MRPGTYFTTTGTGSRGGSGGGAKPFLLSAVISAGGLNYSADIHNIEIYREFEFGNKVGLTLDLEQVVLRGMQDLKLRDGDIIWVPSHHTRFYGDKTIIAVNNLVGAASDADRASDLN